jgi:hypothetical protein
VSIGSEPRSRSTLVERAVVVVFVVAVLAEVVRVGGGVSGLQLGISWQLLDRHVLEHDLLGGLWYLHIQPPLHNLVVGLALWTPFPAEGTLFVLYGGCLLAIGLLSHELARRWGAPGPVAAAVACLIVANPALLATIQLVGYELPVAMLLLTLVSLVDRHVERPSGRSLLAISAVGTAVVLTRALFHPLWLAAVLLVLLVARPVGRRALAVAFIVPVILIGGLVVKNAALVGSPSLSSWTGFNLHRGVLGPMRRDDVTAAVAAGAVSGLAQQRPFQSLDAYGAWVAGCHPSQRNPAIADPIKQVGDVGSVNFNDRCFVPLYDQSRQDALTMIRRRPTRYLSTRMIALGLSFAFSPLGSNVEVVPFVDEPPPRTSWMDRVYRPLLLLDDTSVDMRGWNVPLLGPSLDFELSWTLAACFVAVTVRTAVAAWRAGRAAIARDRWPSPEVVWLVAGGTVVFAIAGGDLIELGENGRFRAPLDPLLVLLVVRLVVEAVDTLRARRQAR